MADEFTVKILSPEEFNKLPFKLIQEDPDSVFGAAEMATKTAYVKDTGFNDLTKANIGHELDELMASTSPHEIDGIRYKSLGNIFSGITGGISNVGSAIGSGIGKIGSGISSGISSLGRGIKNVFTPGPAPDFQQTVAGPQGGSITGLAQGATPKALPALTGGAGTASNFSALKAGVPNAFAAAGGGDGGGFGDFLKNLFGGRGAKEITGPTTAVTAGLPGGPTPAAKPSFFSKISDQLSANPDIAGALVSGIGDLFSKGPGDIDVSGITDPLRSRVSGEGPQSALRQAAEAELLGKLGSDPTAPPESAFIRGDQIIQEDLDDQIKALTQKFKAATGSADVSNNSAFLAEVSRLEERAREHRAAVRDEISFQFTREQLQRDLQEVQTALNLDSAQTEQLIRIAQLDAEALAIQYGLDLREAQEFKELFGNFGDLLFRGDQEATAPTEAGQRSDFSIRNAAGNIDLRPGNAASEGIGQADLDSFTREAGRQGVIDAGIDINTVPPSGQFKIIHPNIG
jgi:hypothetical protein